MSESKRCIDRVCALAHHVSLKPGSQFTTREGAALPHFGAIANAGPSHVQSMCVIGAELVKRGYRFTLFGTSTQVERATRFGFSSSTLGHTDPVVAFGHAVVNNPQNIFGVTLRYMKAMSALLCETAPAAFRQEQIDFVLADQEEPGAATAADLAGIPYATVCSSLPLNEDRWVPPSFAGWHARRDPWTLLCNTFTYWIRNRIVDGVHQVVNRHRTAAGFQPYRRPDDSFSGLAQFTQLVEEFDFARSSRPSSLYYVGPYQRGALKSVSFPWERLDGRPLVYAALGTVQGIRTDLMLQIAHACEASPVQLVLSLGGAELTEQHRRFPGNPIVVSWAPQRELLAKATVMISHAGLNTVMEALSYGVPFVAIPTNGGDQSGVSARIRHFGVGQVLDVSKLSADRLKVSLAELLNDARYREAAVRIRSAIDRTGGAAQVAEMVSSLALKCGGKLAGSDL